MGTMCRGSWLFTTAPTDTSHTSSVSLTTVHGCGPLHIAGDALSRAARQRLGAQSP